MVFEQILPPKIAFLGFEKLKALIFFRMIRVIFLLEIIFKPNDV